MGAREKLSGVNGLITDLTSGDGFLLPETVLETTVNHQTLSKCDLYNGSSQQKRSHFQLVLGHDVRLL